MLTDIFFDYYEYKFIMKINSGTVNNVPELFYTFKSTKTKKVYHVHVEIHPNHFYGVKFHLKDHKKIKGKYNIQTNLDEARAVLFTCIRIMLDINQRDPLSSFGFIGSNTISMIIREKGKEKYIPYKEEKSNTRRYKIYKRMMLTFFTNENFEHVYNEEYSTYLMVRKSELYKKPDLIDEISMYFSDNYNDFD